MEITLDRAKRVLSHKKKDARRRGIECELTRDDIITLYERNNGFCDYTGIEMVDGMTNAYPNNTSIERIDSSRGYVKGNICLVSVAANRLKNSMFDQIDVKAFYLSPTNLPLFEIMKQKLTKNYLDFLKNKYDNTQHYEENNEYTNWFSDTGLIHLVKKEKTLSQPLFVIRSDSGEINIMNQMPMDVRISNYYSNLAKVAKAQDKEFVISFAEFKAKFMAKRCRFTNNSLEEFDKFVILLDKNSSFNKDNIALTSSDFGNKLNEVSDKMGMSILEMSKIFKRIK